MDKQRGALLFVGREIGAALGAPTAGARRNKLGYLLRLRRGGRFGIVHSECVEIFLFLQLTSSILNFLDVFVD
jgi:hypothetical protein